MITARRFRELSFILYGCLTLSAQAPMSVGFGLLLAGMITGAGGPAAYWRDLKETCREPWVRRFLYLSLFFVFACTASVLWARLDPVVFNGHTAEARIPGDLVKMWYWFYPFVVFTGLRSLDGAERRRVVTAWLVALAVFSVVGIQQFFTGWPREQRIPSLLTHYHATAFLGHHLSVATVFLFPVFAALDLVNHKDREKWTTLSKPALAAIVGLGLLALFLTYARSAWISVPIAVVLWGALRFRGKGFAAAAAGALLVCGVLLASPAVRDRLAAGFRQADRVLLWEANWDFFRHRPVLGAGFKVNHAMSLHWLKEHYPGRTWYFMGHAHNNVLDVLGGMGLVGLCAWLGWFGALVAMAVAAWRAGAPGFSTGLICAWAAFHLSGLTQVNYLEGKVQHQLMWAVCWGMLFLWDLKTYRTGSRTAPNPRRR